MPEALSDRLGRDATAGLVGLFDAAERTMTDVVMERCAERFDRRLVDETSKLRVEMHAMGGDLRVEMHAMRSELRVEIHALRSDLLKWSFLFWVGQAAAVATFLRFVVG